jgi:hypothetical protein
MNVSQGGAAPGSNRGWGQEAVLDRRGHRRYTGHAPLRVNRPAERVTREGPLPAPSLLLPARLAGGCLFRPRPRVATRPQGEEHHPQRKLEHRHREIRILRFIPVRAHDISNPRHCEHPRGDPKNQAEAAQPASLRRVASGSWVLRHRVIEHRLRGPVRQRGVWGWNDCEMRTDPRAEQSMAVCASFTLAFQNFRLLQRSRGCCLEPQRAMQRGRRSRPRECASRANAIPVSLRLDPIIGPTLPSPNDDDVPPEYG